MVYYDNMNDYNKLTKREIEVLNLAAQGYNNHVIAEKLFISTHTVKIHLENIFCKLEVHNRIQAAVLAIKKDIIDLASL